MALAVRRPGFLPTVLARVERARDVLGRIPKGLEPQFRPIIEALFALALTQGEFNRRVSDVADFAAQGVGDALTQLENLDQALTIIISHDIAVPDGVRQVFVDASGGNVTITYPSASQNTGRAIAVSKVDETLNLVILAGSGAQTLSGEAEQPLELPYETLDMRSDGADWQVT